MPKISVIIPVYNTEQYLSFCLDSVLLQSFKDFEVICVNDGSTDKSEKILENYSKFDGRIKYINTSHKGAGGARNEGLKVACGEFITFVDSDDTISPLMLENLYNDILKSNADFAFCNVLCSNEKTGENKIWNLGTDNQNFQNALRICAAKVLIKDIYACISNIVCAKLYKKEFLDNIIFDENTVFEDIPYTTEIYLKANIIAYDKNPYYIYRTGRENSVMNQKNEGYKNIFKMREKQEEIFKKYGKYEEFKEVLLVIKMEDFLTRAISANIETSLEMFEIIKEKFNNFNYSEFDNKKIEKIKNVYAKILKMNNEEFIQYTKRIKAAGANKNG